MELEEQEGWSLSAETMEQMLTGDLWEYNEIQLMMLRYIQACEALELPPPNEEDLLPLVEWLEQHECDRMLIDMTKRGDLFYIGHKDGEPTFKATHQGLEKLRRDADLYGREIPEWMEELPSVDFLTDRDPGDETDHR